MYLNLLSRLANLDRCHCGPEMYEAYDELVNFYSDANLLSFDRNKAVNGWKLPPYWRCSKATLADENGNVIASRDNSNLAVYSYSPPVDDLYSLEELQGHLLSDPSRPDAICFHFRNQYRFWAPEWGFSIPHTVRASLTNSVRYKVHIESEFCYKKDFVQSEYSHQGTSDDTYLFMGHFDHPSQVNDGLAGCIVAYEVIKRLKGRKTRFSYKAFASVEIVGSVHYLEMLGSKAENLRGVLFLGFSGIDSPLVYQRSFEGGSMMDRIIRHLIPFYNRGECSVYGHRHLIGNDENVFDSVGYEIPTGTLMRWPFAEYHTTWDSMEITSEERLEEVIELCIRVVDVVENNFYLKATFKGLPCLSHPDIDLYLSPDTISGIGGAAGKFLIEFEDLLPAREFVVVRNRAHKVNGLMQNVLRYSDGSHTILDLAEMSELPFGFVLAYANLLEQKGLLRFCEHPA